MRPPISKLKARGLTIGFALDARLREGPKDNILKVKEMVRCPVKDLGRNLCDSLGHVFKRQTKRKSLTECWTDVLATHNLHIP